MKRLFLLFCILVQACSSDKTVVVPDSVFPKEKMATLMLDVHLLEASMNLNAASPENIASIGGNGGPTSDILKKHNITKKQFDESFDFYTKNPQLLSEVYQLVLNDLSKMHAEVMNKK